MHISYFHTIFLVFTVLTAAHPIPSPPKPDSVRPSSKIDDSLAFLQGLTQNRHDMSGRRGDPSGKYFHESTFHSHYDGRFTYEMLPHVKRRVQLKALVRAYLSTMYNLRAETWIMHGSLLGWWWNRQIMPWDDDIDVQVSESTIEFLAAYQNMTVHSFNTTDLDLTLKDIEIIGSSPKRYLLEINPHYSNPSTSDTLNVIDARWIDVDTGLFIDITTLRIDRDAYPPEETFDDNDEGVDVPTTTTTTKPSPGPSKHKDPRFLARIPHSGPTRMYCKDRHQYMSSQIYPLRISMFEGVPVKIPYAYQELLAEEYGPESLTETDFWREEYEFVKEKKEWVRMGREKVNNRDKLQAEAQMKVGSLVSSGKWVDWAESQEAARRMRKAKILGEVKDKEKAGGGVLPMAVKETGW